MTTLTLQNIVAHERFKVNATEVSDIILAMKRLESRYQASDYLNMTNQRRQLSNLQIDSRCRHMMCEWSNKMADYFKLSRRTAQVSLSCLDRFLSTSKGQSCLCDKSKYQLACIACFYTTVKVHESFEIGVELISTLSQGAYTVRDILDMESLILWALNWSVNPPVSSDFIEHFVTLLPFNVSDNTRREFLEKSRFQTELSLMDYEISVLHKPSRVAMACVVNGICSTSSFPRMVSTLYINLISKFTGCQPNSSTILRITERLASMTRNNKYYELPRSLCIKSVDSIASQSIVTNQTQDHKSIINLLHGENQTTAVEHVCKTSMTLHKPIAMIA